MQLGAAASPHRQPSLLRTPPLASIEQPVRDHEIPIALAAPACPTTRGFLPWRLSDAGPGACLTVAMGRHPKPFTIAATARSPGSGTNRTTMNPDELAVVYNWPMAASHAPYESESVVEGFDYYPHGGLRVDTKANYGGVRNKYAGQVPPIIRAMIVEVVPGIVAVELKPLGLAR
jgi:hypothetical protein